MNNQQTFSTAILKLRQPCRNQVEFEMASLDDRVPADHRARLIVEFVEQMDTEILYREIKSAYGRDGRPSTCPKLLLSLWLYAAVDGITSSRVICELCEHHTIYRWIVGGVSVNRTTLCEFRAMPGSKFEALLTQCLAVMVKEGILNDDTFSQDGTKIKASASGNSARREKSLIELEQSAAAYLSQLVAEHKKDPTAQSKRKKSAQKRAASERLDRTRKALEELKKRQDEVAKSHRSAEDKRKRMEGIRVSSTDPEARKMKMGDGGSRLAYNVQFATGTNTRIIYGVNTVSLQDPGQVVPMMMQVNCRLNNLGLRQAVYWLADTAFSGHTDINGVASLFPTCTLYAPPKPKERELAKIPKRYDSEAVREWRARIDDPSLKERYKQRCSTAEFVNAQTKNRTLHEFTVRGKERVSSFTILAAIAHNIQRYWDITKDKLKVII